MGAVQSEDGSYVAKKWARIRGRLRVEIGEAAFKSWLRPLTLIEIKGDLVILAIPTRFMKDWIFSHYADRIAELWREEMPAVTTVDYVVRPNVDPLHRRHAASPAPAGQGSVSGSDVGSDREDKPEGPVSEPQVAGAQRDRGAASGARGRSMVAPLDPKYTFENFIVGKPNELAHAAARRVADSATASFNPLYLYGGVGLGKTHLMHAIAWHIRRRQPDRQVLYLSAEQFMSLFIRALRFKDTVSFKEMFRSVDVLMIDDVQFIAGKESTQEEFFHTFNALVDQNRQVVISADRSPSDLDGLEERLRSRLGWGLVADIHPTTYELRLGILQAKAEQFTRVQTPLTVLEFLARKITSNVRELEGALNRIVAHAELVARPITSESTAELLADLLRASERKVTIDEIQRRVADHFNIRIADMHSARRSRAVARPRQIAMYLAKQLTPRSLPEIGRRFGGRDHTTVIHAIRKVEELCGADSAFAEDVSFLRRKLEG